MWKIKKDNPAFCNFYLTLSHIGNLELIVFVFIPNKKEKFKRDYNMQKLGCQMQKAKGK